MDKTFNLLGHTVSIQPEQGSSWQEAPAIPGMTPGSRVGATEQLLDKATLAASMERLKRYKAGKAALERRIIDNENWYRLRHWQQVEKQPSQPGLVETPGPRKVSRPASAWLFNSLANKHADAMDNYPEPAVLPREQGDERDAKSLSAILPVILERNDYEQIYSDAWWDKLKSGTAAYGVFWDSAAENGLGDIAIRNIDMLNIYWQPGVTDIQESPHLYIVALVDNDTLLAQYPQLQGKLGGQAIDVPDYIHDDNIDNSNKSVVVDWYYKINRNGRTVLHYCKFCAGEVLFASEGNPEYDEGWYSHGQYPVVLDVLFPIKGSPAGFGFVDIMRDPQLYIDSLDEIILNNARLAGTPRWFIRDNAGISREQYADWRQPFVDVAISLDENNIQQISVNPLDGYIINHLQHKIEELKETSGNRDFNQGGSNSGVTAAAAISALQEAGNKLSRDMLKGSYRSFVEVNHLLIELIRQFYDERRCFRIEGAGGAAQYIEYNNSGLRPQSMRLPDGEELYRKPVFDIKVKAQKANPFSRMTQNELAKELYSLGFFNPEMAEPALTALEMMEFEGKNNIIEKVRQGQTLMNVIQAQQQTIAKMSAVLNLDGGAVNPSKPGAGAESTGSSRSAAAMGNELDSAQLNATAYADRLATQTADGLS